jgi:Flp pilus assembly protein TadD
MEPAAAVPAPPALAVTEPAPSAAYREAMAEVGARYEAGDLAGAAAACRRATTIDPSVGAGWMALGEVELAAGNRDGARAAFERYLAAEPGGRHAARIRALLERLRP